MEEPGGKRLKPVQKEFGWAGWLGDQDSNLD